MKPLINILLILTVVTCPVRCYVSGSCCGGRGTIAQADQLAECCCSDQSNQDEGSRSNQPRPELPCKKGHCFCSGAMLPDLFDVDFDTSWEFLVVMDFDLQYQTIDYMPLNCRGPDWVDAPELQSANIGRTIRCLHCSLTI